VKRRLRAVRAAAPAFMPAQQKAMSVMQQQASIGHAGMPAGVFGKKKGWADQLADEDALQQHQQQQQQNQQIYHQHHHMNMVPMGGMRPNAGAHQPSMTNRQLAYVLPNGNASTSALGLASKPPSPIDANVKFVNSTVENLQSQIKKEEAPKKKRTRTSPEQLRILQKAFATDPMPSSQARLALSKKLGMNPRAVQVWFQNRRAKAKRAESMGLSGIDDLDGMSGGSGGSDDELGLGLDLQHGGQFHTGHISHDQSRKMGGNGSRAASMSSVMPMPGYSLHQQQIDAAYFGLHAGGPSGNAGAFFDPSSFMEPVEHAYEHQDMVLPGLDFNSMYGAGGCFAQPGNYAMPMQGMFSLPPSAYDMGMVNGGGASGSTAPDMMRGYTGQQQNQQHQFAASNGQYPSYTDATQGRGDGWTALAKGRKTDAFQSLDLLCCQLGVNVIEAV